MGNICASFPILPQCDDYKPDASMIYKPKETLRSLVLHPPKYEVQQRARHPYF